MPEHHQILGVSSDAVTETVTRVTVVHAPACHFCEDAERTLDALGEGFHLEVSVVDVDSGHGRSLVAEHRPAMNPLVLVDGRFFSAGRLPRRKLEKLLRSRGVPAGSAGR